MKERKEKKKNRIQIYGFVGLIAVMSIVIIIFNSDLNDESKYLIDVISPDPQNYLEKRTNLEDGSIHYHFNYTERMGTSNP